MNVPQHPQHELRDQLLRAQQSAIATGTVPPVLRPVIRESWERAIRGSIDPDRALPSLELDEDAFREYRAAHALAPVLPVIRRLLVDGADDAGLVVAVGDSRGRLLWVEGDAGLRRRAEDMLFVAGADWSEARVGTSAPGTALQLDRAMQIRGAEHYNRIAHPWSCTAAPVHDPVDGALLGVIDITGTDHAVAPHTLSLVSATVAAVEAELRIVSLESTVRAARRTSRTTAMPTAKPVRTPLSVLGGRRPQLGSRELSRRHAEILVLLAWHRQGLGAERLASLVYESDASPVTLRAEIVRLRRVLEAAGEPPLESRPYRLGRELDLDAASVAKLLGQGALRRAAERYAGPVLPDSTAPGVVELRDDLAGRLRESMLSDASPELLLAYADRDECRYDTEVWRALLGILPPRSPRRASVVAHLERIESALR
ncbi:transcriptional regulator [Agromyces badenianii]|uniref:Transcriptional regulator n=1 Tax=Agromyces badenianii TaxID=2080742 RepID=A0A2S0WV22_9MICO|nr:helix-turn-helix domain-containing protein [Agromyces badenianii]AWB95148.1 transcriptional regulator [Agromyces badenianii]